MLEEKNRDKKQINRQPNKKLIGDRRFFSGGRGKLSVFVIICWALFGFSVFYFPKASASPAASDTLSENAEVAEPAAASAAPQDFSRFTHTNASHRSVSCLLCHQRADNSPRIQRPGHSTCIGCHSQEFNNNASPICTICHTDPASGAVKAFPPLRSFNAIFSHAVHNRRGAAPREGCATCHRPAGAARSIPDRLNAHTTCFQCHTNRAQAGGRDISSCGTCHQLGRLTRTPETAPAFRLGFSHAEHARTNCAECHQVRAGTRGNQVTSTVPAMHFPPAGRQSCASCHNDRRVFGGNDFTDCKRCHDGNRFGFR